MTTFQRKILQFFENRFVNKDMWGGKKDAMWNYHLRHVMIFKDLVTLQEIKITKMKTSKRVIEYFLQNRNRIYT